MYTTRSYMTGRHGAALKAVAVAERKTPELHPAVLRPCFSGTEEM